VRKYLLIKFFILFQVFAFGQNNSSYGSFNNLYFSVKDFNSSSLIWSGTQHENGNVYFGNDTGILEFNGVSWKNINADSTDVGSKIFNAVHKTKVSKLYTAKNKLTYVGRMDNFGYLTYSKKGEIVYKPLFCAKEFNELGQVWNIFENGNTIYFIGENKVFSYDGSKVQQVSIPDVKGFYCKTAGKIDEGIFLVYKPEGESSARKYKFFDFKTKKVSDFITPYGNFYQEKVGFLSISGTVKINNYWFVFNLDGTVLRVEKKNGKFVFKKDELTNYSFKNLLGQTVNSIKANGHIIYVSTGENGLFILNRKGQIIRRFDLYDEMENLNVYEVFNDDENNIWLCLDNGIHFFETSSTLTIFNKKDGIEDAIVKMDRYDDKHNLIATLNSVLIDDVSQNRKYFKSSEAISDQMFHLKTYETDYGKKTIAIVFDGIYEVDIFNKTNKKISGEYSYVTYQNPINKNEFFVGLDKAGVGKLTLTKSGWIFENLFPEFKNDVISFAAKGNKLIFGLKDEGVFVYDIKKKTINKVKTTLHSDIKTQYYVEEFNNQIFVGMETGLYTLDKELKNLVPFKEINNHFQGLADLSIHRLVNQNDQKLWIVIPPNESKTRKVEHGWLEFKNNKWKWTSWPFEPISFNKNPIVEDVLFVSENETWLCAGNTIYVFDPKTIDAVRKKFTVSIDELYVNSKLLVYNPLKSEKLPSFDFQNNSFKYIFHANSFIGMKNVKYRYKLEGFLDKWSEWSDLNFAEFQKISEGTYTLKIQAKNIYGFESEVLEYTFTILPPWYRSWWAYTFYVIAFFFLIYVTVKLSIQRVKNQNIKLEEIVEERTSEIAEQNKQLETQKTEIQQKTQDIVDSIVYAKRIQETILPTERLDKMFEDYFVFYRPKDIVSGDFYWARQKGNLAIFSAIDCTGHGVPGALVSIVGNASLLRCVNEHRLTEPSEILNKHRDIVVKSFVSKGHTDVKDGMDMSLCVLDLDTLIMKYAGANNECVIIRNKEIIELKPDKQPIGQFSHAKPFTQQEIQLQVGDCIYQYTDGYVDQFGGEKGKKLKSKPFKEYLKEISHLSMKEQAVKIENYFDVWKGDLDQIDDVCVFGVKL
jgi:serine phosphatase RsbU (regulator of sigma subunit)